MKHHLIRAGGFSFALMVLLGSVPAAIQAQTSSYGSQLLASHTSSYGRVSSSLSRKINDLDDDIVEKLPIPILTGVAMRNITENFGDPRDGGARLHEGLDIMAPKGAFIVSPTEAVVTRIGDGAGSGKYVRTANPGGESFVYMHLDDPADGLRVGDVLEPGDLIGYVGNTGNASGGAPHLHFEIRDGREALDPYPRITREFTTEERAEALAKIVENADDEEEEAEKIVAAHRSLLIAAQAAGVDFPEELEDALGEAAPAVSSLLAGDASFVRDLTIGSRGVDVTMLQSFLIAEDSGPATDALLAAGATGYFGPITQRALAEYQAKVGISPTAGYFGPLTRARILSVI